MNIPIKYLFSNNNYTIEINSSYKYSSSYKRKNFNNIYQFLNNGSLFKYISLNHKDSYNGNLIIDNFEFKLDNFINNISLNIYLESILSNTEAINLYKDDNSFISIKIYKYADVFQIKENEKDIENNLEKIESNEKNISTNLINMNINEDNIAINTDEINNLKKNKTYLKNLYNKLFYNEKTQIDFNNIFYEKVFDVDASINDFIEIQFMFDLQANNVFKLVDNIKLEYKILDNNISLYSKEIKLIDEYKYSSDRIFIKENIFYNFKKTIYKIKFVIKFNTIFNEPNKLYYLNNDNRLILKHYSP